jgi:hypothetical protein
MKTVHTIGKKTAIAFISIIMKKSIKVVWNLIVQMNLNNV